MPWPFKEIFVFYCRGALKLYNAFTMRILIFGLPGSGKTTLAKELIKHFPCLYLNGDKVRDLFEDKDFSKEGRLRQARRMRVLADMAPKAMVIADFVCPTKETRKIFGPHLSIWLNTIEDCRFKNTNKIFEIPKKANYIISTKDVHKHSPLIIKRLKEMARHEK